jgi:hypothetical protein
MKMNAMKDKQPKGAQLITISFCLDMLLAFLFEFALLVDAIAVFNHLVPFPFGDAKSSTNSVAQHMQATVAPAAMIWFNFCIDCSSIFVVVCVVCIILCHVVM